MSGNTMQPFIDGKSIPSNCPETMESINPSTGQPSGLVPVGDPVDVDRAVISARRTFRDSRWSDLSPSIRKTVLHRFANSIEAHAGELDAIDAEAMGKPVSVGFANAESAAKLTRFYAEAVDKVMGDVYNSDPHSLAIQRRVPRGVVGAVVPWNFPTYCALLKCAPALAAGNSIVLKPSELSSGSAIRLAMLAIEAGLPPGALNVVPGLGTTVGRALGRHMDVDLLTFTGSTAVGKLMMQYAGESNMKPVMLECGGKSPHIVFDDGVNLDAAAASIASILLTNQGQVCSVGSRLLVQRSIEPNIVEKIAAHMALINFGDARDPRTTFGPLASARQLDRVMGFIESGSADGAHLAVGGQRVMRESGGYFVEPTLFRAVSPTAKIAREEIFGPVLSVIPFDDEEEAIRIANSTQYALTAFVWTDRLSTGMRVSKLIRSTVFINAAPLGEGAGHAASSEPAGQSGFGAESGLDGMESYLRRQLVTFTYS